MAYDIVTVKAGARHFRVKPEHNGKIIEFGPAGTPQQVSTMNIQIAPDLVWVGQFILMGRSMGKASDYNNAPFLPIPYRRVTLGNAASDYAIVSDPLSATAIIDVPANGKSIAVLCACTAGTCDLLLWDLQGSCL